MVEYEDPELPSSYKHTKYISTHRAIPPEEQLRQIEQLLLKKCGRYYMDKGGRDGDAVTIGTLPYGATRNREALRGPLPNLAGGEQEWKK